MCKWFHSESQSRSTLKYIVGQSTKNQIGQASKNHAQRDAFKFETLLHARHSDFKFAVFWISCNSAHLRQLSVKGVSTTIDFTKLSAIAPETRKPQAAGAADKSAVIRDMCASAVEEFKRRTTAGESRRALSLSGFVDSIPIMPDHNSRSTRRMNKRL